MYIYLCSIINKYSKCLFWKIGSPKPDVVWLHEDKTVPPSPKLRTHEERGIFTLTLINASPHEAGLYTCRAFNSFGRADTRATIRVVARGGRNDKPAMFVERPDTTLGVALGEDITISFRVAGEPRPQGKYLLFCSCTYNISLFKFLENLLSI